MQARSRRLVAVAVVAVLGGVAAAASAGAFQLRGEPGSIPELFTLCSEAQLDIANIDPAVAGELGIAATTKTYQDFTDFVNSKSGADPASRRILDTGFVDYLNTDADAELEQAQVRCKLRTAESLDGGAWPPGNNLSPNGARFDQPPYFGFGSIAADLAALPGPSTLDDLVTSTTDATCASVQQEIVSKVWDTIPVGTTTTYPRTGGVLVDEVASANGPAWTGGAVDPLTPNGGTLVVTTKSLLVPTSDVTLGPRFSGAHYCTFVAPAYLKAVLLGTATA